jgi:invasion protein IalB
MTEFSNQRAAPMSRPRQRPAGILSRGVVIGLMSFALLLVGAAAGFAADRIFGGQPANELRLRTFGDWRVTCPAPSAKPPNCTLTQDVRRDTGEMLLSLTVADPSPGKPLSITVPSGVLLDSGLGITVGKQAMKVRPYETCSNAGCFAFLALDADTLKELQTNTGGQVTIAVPGNDKPIALPFSLRGFADGFADLAQVHAERTGLLRFLFR